MITRKVVTTGAVTVHDHSTTTQTAAPPIVVGDPPQWADNSDATYAELETFEHPDASFTDNANAYLAPNPSIRPNAVGATVTARIRYQSMSVDMAPPWLRVKDAGNSEYLLDSDLLPPPGSSSPTWLELPLLESTGGRLGVFLSRISSGVTSLQVEVYGPFLQTYTFRYPRTRIFEVELIVTTPGGDAPPGRIFPRSDGLGVGGGRNYPPAKSQQRSPRGVGYY